MTAVSKAAHELWGEQESVQNSVKYCGGWNNRVNKGGSGREIHFG